MDKGECMYSEKILKRLLRDVAQKKLSLAEAYEQVKDLPYEVLSAARIDHHRSLRHSIPEVVYAPGKTQAQLCEIADSFIEKRISFVITRLKKKTYENLVLHCPALRYSEQAQVAYQIPRRKSYGTVKSRRMVAVLSAGSGDIPVAEEAAIVVEIMGCRARRLYDCGVAGIHRLVDHYPVLKRAAVIICVAGMEGALPSVVGGLLDKPIIAVPTSVGYGANLAGVSPLLTMLNSCSPGIAVVNIDNGFGAGVLAARIARK